MNDRQQARDYADQKQFKADVINYSEHKHYSIDGEEADKYLLELFENNFPKLHNDAMKVATTCAEEMAVTVIAGVAAIDPNLISNFRRPNVQAALLSAQQSFAETGDPDTGTGDVALGRLLSRLVVKLVTGPARNLNDIVTRRAIAIAPHLTREQVNSLSVLAVFNTCTCKGDTPSELLAAMNTFYCAYYNQVASHSLEYSYMESAGVGSSLFGFDVYQQIFNKHRPALRTSFDPASISANIEESDRAMYLEPDPTNPGLMRVRSDKLDETGRQQHAIRRFKAKSVWLEVSSTTAIICWPEIHVTRRTQKTCRSANARSTQVPCPIGTGWRKSFPDQRHRVHLGKRRARSTISW